MNTVTSKIDNAYMLYILSNKDIGKACSLTKISPVTMQKYITIKEHLDITLFNDLDKKGKDKLMLGFALYLCKNILNPEIQITLYPDIMKVPAKERIPKATDLNTCLICADTNINFEILPCCNTPICESCLTSTINTSINDLAFQSPKCPFCNVCYDYSFIKWFLKNMYSSYDEWRRSKEYIKSRKFSKRYNTNLYYKFHNLIGLLKRLKGYDGEDLQLLMDEDKYYGPCYQCSPLVSNTYTQRVEFEGLRLSSVDKQCVNGEGDIVVLQPQMFQCNFCKNNEENIIIKKCPHCGIKTLKPEGCNYVICGDHNWCFICNERLESNHNGHNVHYWMGGGTSAWSDKCRKSENHNAPTFILKKCNCYSCRGQHSFCRNLDCMDRCQGEFCSLCG